MNVFDLEFKILVNISSKYAGDYGLNNIRKGYNVKLSLLFKIIIIL